MGNIANNVTMVATNNDLATDITEKDALTFTLAARDLNSTINLDNISVGVFLTAMENVAALRAQNGATMSRLSFRKSTFLDSEATWRRRWPDQGYRYGGRKYPNGKVQRIKAGVRGDACTGEHFPGSRPHAHPLTLTAINQPILKSINQ